MSKPKSAVEAKLSKKFIEYVREHSESYPNPDEFLTSLEEWPVKAVRANTHAITIEELAERWNIPCDYVPWCKDAIYFDWDRKVGSTPEHEQGLCYVGDPSAMLPLECIDVAPDAFVIDMCAAPGGKTAHVLNALGGSGRIVANDVDRPRARILQGNLDRLMSAIDESDQPDIEVTSMSSIELDETFHGEANVVILDAPCSGEAMMRRSNMARRQWSEKLVASMAQLQSELLRVAIELLAPGGQIVYSTCTFNERENEHVLMNLRNVPGLKIEEPSALAERLKIDGLVQHERSISLYPHKVRGDGQSVAVLSI